MQPTLFDPRLKFKPRLKFFKLGLRTTNICLMIAFIYRDDQTDGTLPDTDKKQRKVTFINIFHSKIGIIEFLL